MCELLGLCFARPVAADFSLNAFAMRDEMNADGWGLAWYSDRSLSVVKEPVSWRESDYARFLTTYPALVSHMYIAHVRHATVGGEPKRSDTHPFQAELGGRTYCFAHNGTVRGAFEALQLGRFQPVGHTDSEHAFCYLMNGLARSGRSLATASDWAWLAEQFTCINEMGKFNCLISDGERLAAWHDINGFKGLHFHGMRMRGPEIESLEDPTMDVQIDSPSHNRGIVVATQPLNDIGWHAFLQGELLVIESGRIVYSSTRVGNCGIRSRPRSAAECNGAGRP